MNPIRRSRRLGITLVELMVAITITGIVGAALIQVMMAQNRAAGNNEAWRVARSVSRGSLNRLLADLRMAEANGALDAATVDGRDITVRVPYAFGVACNSTLPMAVSILPVDNALWSASVFAGWAWRDGGTAAYVYRRVGGTANATIFSPGTGSVCAIPGDTITTLPLGRVVNLNASSFGVGGTPGRGMNVFVYQRVRYWFAASTALPGQIALWRSVLNSGTEEELAAPFDTTARFRFYLVGSSTAQDSPLPRSDVRGIEIHLDGLSETVPQGSTAQKRIALTTSVFFKNHHD